MIDRHATLSARAAGREVALIAVAAFVYFGVRGSTQDKIGRAFENADWILRVERALAIDWERALQDPLLEHQWLLTATNWVYVYGHWPVIAACGVALYLWRRDRYVLLRNAMFISGLIGFAFFAGFPTAPPRFADPGVVDTVSQYSHGYRALQPPALTNKYAAFPSLHLGWNLLVGIVLFGATRRPAIRAFAVVMPVAMAFAVVATANHFVLDVVGGTAVVLVGFFAARHLSVRTIEREGGQPARRVEAATSPVRRRSSVGELPRGVAGGRGARRRRDRGRRAPLSRPPRGAPSEDAGAGSDPLGPVEARKPVRAAPSRH
ncbi:MAG TPA: phosphatase PAP2 family protein [Gaiellaceae bacterium]|jgi:hypothetical protein